MASKPSKAPFVVFGGMIAIGLTGLLSVLISNCMREEPYMDTVEIKQGDPGRLPPPPPDRR